MNDNIKLCKDCHYFIAKDDTFGMRLCGHPKAALGPDLVTGDPQGQYFCTAMRVGADCGRTAKLFEPKLLKERA